MNFIEEMKNIAKQHVKRIVLPESQDIRVQEAARKITDAGFAKVILIGDENEIHSSVSLDGIEIINPHTSDKYDSYVKKFYELRKEKGIDLEKAKEFMKNNIYYGTMMVYMGDADGLVAGSICSTADTLRPALQILKTSPNTKIVSSFFILNVPNCQYGEEGTFLFSDCGLNANPNAEELAEIAISSCRSWKQLINKEERIAMLSYSTLGSAPLTELTSKVINATNIVKDKYPELNIDGELQLDSAIIPSVANQKAPKSKIAGKANILIFPDLNSGNIGYKLVQRLAGAEAYGPITQGIKRPVNDLSRGCSVDDIVGVVAITAVQASQEDK